MADGANDLYFKAFFFCSTEKKSAAPYFSFPSIETFTDIAVTNE